MTKTNEKFHCAIGNNGNSDKMTGSAKIESENQKMTKAKIETRMTEMTGSAKI